MFISLTSFLLATYVSAVVAAPLDTRSLASNELQVRGPPKAGAGSGKKTCAPKASGKKRSLPESELPPRSILDQIVALYRRNGEEFIGWHGTSKMTTDLWASHGAVIKPANNAGRSGLDQELGPGLYVSDTLSAAIGFSNTNSQNQHLIGTQDPHSPRVCAIYAKNSADWKKVSKAEIPFALRGNAPEKETQRRKYVADAAMFKGDGVRFSPLATNPQGEWQMCIPESLNPTLHAVCYDVIPGTLQSPQAVAASANLHVRYNDMRTRHDWNIWFGKESAVPEIQQEVKDEEGCLIA